MNRKPDRNGNIIALITYKHLESCDYAIKIFNGISLFNQALKVQFSQSNASNLTSKASSGNLNAQTPVSSNVNHYQNRNNRHTDQQQQQNSQSPGINPHMSKQHQQHLYNLMIQSLSPSPLMNNPFFNQAQGSPFPLMNNQNFNRSKSGSHLQNFDNDNRNLDRNNSMNRERDRSYQGNRNNGHNNGGRDHSSNNYRSRDGYSHDRHNNGNNNNNRSRSRSPHLGGQHGQHNNRRNRR